MTVDWNWLAEKRGEPSGNIMIENLVTKGYSITGICEELELSRTAVIHKLKALNLKTKETLNREKRLKPKKEGCQQCGGDLKGNYRICPHCHKIRCRQFRFVPDGYADNWDGRVRHKGGSN
jgi:hypothetical protein